MFDQVLLLFTEGQEVRFLLELLKDEATVVKLFVLSSPLATLLTITFIAAVGSTSPSTIIYAGSGISPEAWTFFSY